MGEVSDKLDSFLGFLRDCEQQFRMAEADVQEANDATQDILHSLELEEHDDAAFIQLSKELRDVRQARRKAKDSIAVLTPVLTWAEDNRAVIKRLEQLLGAVRKAENATENRIYTPRTRRRGREAQS